MTRRDRRHVGTPQVRPDQETANAGAITGAMTGSIPDDLLEEALAYTGLTDLSPEVQRSVLGLTPETASVEPATWTQLLEAAHRGIQHHRNDSAALPRMLFVRRCEKQASLDDVATAIGVPAKQLDAIEHGHERIETLTAANVAAWIRFLDVEIPQARASLRKALELQRREDVSLAAAASPDAKGADDGFVEEVVALLEAEAGHP